MRIIFTSALAVLLIITLVAPVAFFIAPPRASADSGSGCVVGLAAGLASVATNQVKSVPSGDSPSGAAGWTSAGSNVGSCLYNLVVVPILRQMIRNLLQQMTQATIAWVNGSNSTGRPSFVPNLSVHLQAVMDSAALGFFNGIASGALNSPFGPAISFSLQAKYAQQSSMAGFFAANKSTLTASSPNITAFLAGNWAQGGAKTWFALTGPSPNNPFILQQTALSQLGNNVSQAVTNRRQDLIQSGGFLSYCPGDSTAVSGATGVNPRAQCKNPDGTDANATTPGSTIKSYLDTNLASGVGQLVSAQDLDAAIGQVVTALANTVLGPTGLFGASQPSGSTNTTIVANPTINVNQLTSGQDSTTSQAVSAIGNNLLTSAGIITATSSDASSTNVTAYSTAWTIISTSATRAKNDVNALTAQCALGQGILPAQVTAAKTKVQQILTQANTALGRATNNVASTTITSNDVIGAQGNALQSGGSIATPQGSLNVSGGTLVDQVNLIGGNAGALQAVCDAPVINNNPPAG